MKIGNPHSPASPQSAPSEAQRSSSSPGADRERTDDGKGKAFGSALEKKASEKKALDKQGDTNAMNPAQGLPPFLMQNSSVGPIEAAQAGAVSGVLPPEISALSGEILHTLEVSGPNEVRIQFDASVLDGLSVSLTREAGALQVTLQASSPEMARFLEVHAASLAQTLDRPERAAFISIEARPAPRDQQGGGHGHGGQNPRDHDDREQASPTGDDR